ncbi:ABC transporter ATP-binding protein [Streptococcus danieliae]|uniref:ABC transporter ATP-binding protein n=1 Tax=Streptococcus danieliae TaxID=747656 RepID=A0A7Z0M526_9STRE|nr:ABC transporter ATP-binding protein [Streptococcus danieliae]MBF0698664.1 ABC transporter ATP-binding protein [Streptococcus danieliae]NYS95841.1 ABC transporter ATP-binding protein [Streptococcus danieliae]
MLEVSQVTGGYFNLPVLKEISFSVQHHEIVGLIGLNGAGKSTTIKEIIGFLQPYAGIIRLDGQELQTDPVAYRKKIGYIPETPMLYEELTLREHFEIVAMAYEKDLDQSLERLAPYLKRFRLDQKLDWLPAEFSKGMKQKVMILCAILVDPDLYIVDEPFLGLDPLAIEDLLQFLLEERKKGKGILMSTHVLDTAERVCDRYILLHQGQVLAEGSLAAIQEQFQMPDQSLHDIYLRVTQED